MPLSNHCKEPTCIRIGLPASKNTFSRNGNRGPTRNRKATSHLPRSSPVTSAPTRTISISRYAIPAATARGLARFDLAPNVRADQVIPAAAVRNHRFELEVEPPSTPTHRSSRCFMSSFERTISRCPSSRCCQAMSGICVWI